jgi:Esterase-like activity of phytase
MDAPTPIALPCPLSAGWEVVEQRLIEPSQGGGFSAGAYRPEVDELWLLSDAPRGNISRWRGFRAGGLKGLVPLPPLPLKQPQPMDGEGLVVEAQHFWVATEGRLQPAQPAALLRYDMAAGSLLSSRELPQDWRLQPKRGLGSNGGPESLSRSPEDGALLMAAELRPLALPPGGWGLTDLLASKQGLLGLWRRFTAPDQWQGRLVLFPASAITTMATSNADVPPVAPLISWNLLQLGLAPDNWEVLLAAPPLGDGRPSLLLATDDNFNPLQRSHLARLVPRQLPGCSGPPQQ